MKKILFLLLISLSVFAFGCKEEAKTVQWYTDHPEERSARLQMCGDNPGKYQNDPDCINARQSFLRNSGGSVRR